VRIFAVINFAKSKKGPKTLNKVRKILCIKAPDLDKLDINADDKKFTIIGAGYGKK
jgi:hypothetical protein